MSRSPAQPARTLVATLATTLTAATISALPVLLLGGLAVLIRGELDFGEFGLGIAIGSFFTASALVSLPAGAVSERIGPSRTMAVGLAGTAAALAGIAVFPTSLALLVPWLILAGAANALIQVGANHLLAVGVHLHRQGLAYGVKQSAIPLAAMLAGASVPVIGLTLGWRTAYGVAAGLGLAGLVFVWRVAGSDGDHEPATEREGDAPISALVVLALGAGLGTTAANALTGFSVSSSVDAGLGQDVAGVLLTIGSLLGMSVRIGGGWLADRLARGSLLLVAGLLAIGAFGYAGLALRPSAGLVLVGATLVAFLGGWGYQGLVLLATARTNPASPAAALAIVRIGPNAGAVIGPLIFGAIVERAGYGVAWGFAAAASLGAALLVLVGRSMLVPVRRRIVAARDARQEPR